MTLLSHYTSRPGLEGIAKNKCIRATKFSQLTDKREIEYGYIEFVRRSILSVFAELDKFMPRNSGVKLDLAAVEAELTERFRNSFNGPTASEPLYVASFAKGKTEDHNKRGMFTLWERFTQLNGYCLQFDSEDVRQSLSLEATRRNYAMLSLDDVHYEMDEESLEYRELMFQMKQLLMIEVMNGLPDLPIEPEYERMWAFNAYAARMLRYVAKHKDPFFEDERETRIIAVPATKAEGRIFTGVASVRRPETDDRGRQFISIGGDWRPGLEPRRVIIGPHASAEIHDVVALFQRKPEIITASFPV